MKRLYDYAQTIWKQLVKILLNPFDDILYLILLWVINSLSSLLPPFVQGDIKYTIYIALLYFPLTYIIVTLLDINKCIGKILKPIIFVGSYIYLLINIYVFKTYRCLISYDIVEIILESNLREIHEYVDTYLSINLIILLFISVCLGILICYIAVKFRFKKINMRLPLVILLLVSLAAVWHNSAIVKDVLISHRWIVKMDEVVNLENHLTYPYIFSSDRIPSPQYVIIIIGESFAPSHSSLYGYEKDTNPKLSCLVDSGDLVVFDRVTSPKTHTTSTFRYLLNTFRLGMENECKWYDTTTLIEVLNTVVYHTVWLSNQDERGQYDNLPSGYSRLCDEVVFMTKDTKGFKYDESLLDVKIPDTGNRHAVFYHLMGQHVAFKSRYPQEYDIFKSKDYQCYSRNKEQAKVLAEYDNATLYNDMIVSSIINKYKNMDAVVFYLSDHGLDLFDTDEEYFGHARNTSESQTVGQKVPFMVYMSPLYRILRPNTAQRIIEASKRREDFCTDKLIYTVMDVTGLEFSNNDDVLQYSLFNTAREKAAE